MNHRLASNHLRELDRLTRKVINDCSGKDKHESTPLLYLQPEQGGKRLVVLETLYKNTKLKIANYINNSKDQHIKLVKSSQLKKEQSQLRSIFKDAKKYAEQLNIECDFDDGETILRNGDKEMRGSGKEPYKVKSIINKANTDRHMRDTQNQLWVGKFVTLHWNDPQISNNSYDIFKQWKNIRDIVMSIDTSIRQQLPNTKKLHEQVEELSRRLCSENRTVSHVLCGCSHIAQSLYKTRHDKMLRPVYHALLAKYGFDESDYSSPWHMQSHPQPRKENREAKILWDIVSCK